MSIKIDRFSSLPEEMLYQIFSYLEFSDLAHLSCCSKLLRSIANDAYLWQSLSMQMYGSSLNKEECVLRFTMVEADEVSKMSGFAGKIVALANREFFEAELPKEMPPFGYAFLHQLPKSDFGHVFSQEVQFQLHRFALKFSRSEPYAFGPKHLKNRPLILRLATAKELSLITQLLESNRWCFEYNYYLTDKIKLALEIPDALCKKVIASPQKGKVP